MIQTLSLANNELISCLGLEELSSLRELDVSVRG
jgi:Leucine-rich repeat (LRR) protein